MGKQKNKIFLLTVFALLWIGSAFALLKTGVFGNEKNFLATDGNVRYDIVADLGEGGKFEPSAKPEFTKMDNGKWIHKYQPSAKPVKLPRPVKDGYTFEGWLVEGDPTPKPEYSIPAWNKENINLSVKWKSATSDLLSGYEFNKKIKSMAGFDKVTEIKFINETPKLEGTDLSEKQNGYIKGSISGNVLTVACSGRIYASSNASNMFNGCSKLTKITLNNFDTSKVTTTGSMFSGCSGLTILDLGTFDTSKVLDMNSMFQECSSLTTIDVSKWDTSRVNSMYNMFNGCSSLELLDLSKLNISNVTDMCYMFSNCSKLTSEITISRVTKPDNISFMFAGCSSAADAKFIVKYTSLEAKEIAKQMVATKRDGVDHVYLYDPNYTLLAGPQFSSKVKTMLNFKNVTEIKFVRASANPDGIDLSEKQDGSIMGHIEGDVLTVVSQQHIFANPDCSGMFEGMSNIESITFENFDTSNVTNMSSMFNDCKSLNGLNLSGFNTSKVTEMYSMFRNCRNLISLNINNFNTSSVIGMSNMFLSCENLITLDLASFDTSKVENIYYMFRNCKKLRTIKGLETFDVTNAGHVNCMFQGCTNLTGEITLGGKNYRAMFTFNNCSTSHNSVFIVKIKDNNGRIAGDIRSNKGSHVYLYEKTYTLTSGRDFNSKVKSIPGFDNVKHIKFVKGSPTMGTALGEGELVNTVNVDPQPDPEPPEDTLTPKTCNPCAIKGNIKGDTLYISAVGNGNIIANPDCSGMFEGMSNIESVTFENFDMSSITNMSRMFKNCSKLSGEMTVNKSIGSYQEMFLGCSSNSNAEFWVKYISPETKNVAKQMVATKREGIDHVYLYELGAALLPGPEFNSKIKAMPGFSNVTKIRFVNGMPNPGGTDFSEKQDRSITGKVDGAILTISCESKIQANPDCSKMFQSLANITSIDFNNFDTSKTANMQYMFAGIMNLENLDLRCFDTSKVIDMSSMFDGGIIGNKLHAVDMSSFNVSNVTKMTNMFYNNSNLLQIKGLENFKFNNEVFLGDMFENCSKLNGEMTVNFTAPVSVGLSIFSGCSSDSNAEFWVKYTSTETKEIARRMVDTKREGIDHVYLYETEAVLLPGPEFVKTIKNMPGYDTGVTEIRFIKGVPNQEGTDLSESQSGSIKGHISENVLTITCQEQIYANPDSSYMFSYMRNINRIEFNNFNTSKVTNMDSMFEVCGDLVALDLGNFDTSKVVNMRRMFSGCKTLVSVNINNFDVTKVTNMRNMFTDCRSLSSLNVRNFDTSNVTDMSGMFMRCMRLTTLDIRNFDTSNVTDMNGMFNTCMQLITLDVRNFNTSNVTDMSGMFEGCMQLASLDMSRFNTSKVTDMGYMFSSCRQLTSLNLSKFDTSKVTDMSYMFDTCEQLISLDLRGFNTTSVTNMYAMFTDCDKLKGEITIMNPETDYHRYDGYDMFFRCSTAPGAEFTVHYVSPETKVLAQGMINTKSTDSKVYLGIQKSIAADVGAKPSIFNAKYTPNTGALTNIATTPKPVKLTLINGPSAQYPKQIMEIKNNKIPNLNAPDLNPLYAGQFGGYYYDEQFTKPVKQGDIITRDLTIYARW